VSVTPLPSFGSCNRQHGPAAALPFWMARWV